MWELLSGLLNIGGNLIGNKSKQSFTKSDTATTNASSTDLSNPLLTSLEALLGKTLNSGGFTNANNAIGTRLKQLSAQAKQPQFNVDKFAAGITKQATSAADLDLTSAINGILSKTGTTESGNSASALLANKLRNQTAANLAGISAQATATGEQIREGQQGQLTEGIGNLGNSLVNEILGLLQSTRGARQSGTSTTNESSFGSGSGTDKGNPFAGLSDIFKSFNTARTDA